MRSYAFLVIMFALLSAPSKRAFSDSENTFSQNPSLTPLQSKALQSIEERCFNEKVRYKLFAATESNRRNPEKKLKSFTAWYRSSGRRQGGKAYKPLSLGKTYKPLSLRSTSRREAVKPAVKTSQEMDSFKVKRAKISRISRNIYRIELRNGQSFDRNSSSFDREYDWFKKMELEVQYPVSFKINCYKKIKDIRLIGEIVQTSSRQNPGLVKCDLFPQGLQFTDKSIESHFGFHNPIIPKGTKVSFRASRGRNRGFSAFFINHKRR